jgi:hypothetical protein
LVSAFDAETAALLVAIPGCWAKAADTPKKIATTDTPARFNDI